MADHEHSWMGQSVLSEFPKGPTFWLYKKIIGKTSTTLESMYKKVNLDFKMYSFGSKYLKIHTLWYVCERIEPMFPTLGTDLWGVPEKKTNNHSNCIEHNVWQLLTLSAFNVQGRKPLAKVLSRYIS